MLKRVLILFIASGCILLSSCSKKTVPSKTAKVTVTKINTVSTTTKKETPPPPPTKPDTAAVSAASEKPAPKPQAKPEFPLVITVNDNAAKKSVDGRLFYDVLGHRYWKNYSDGKYYLFDKSMYNNPDFKPHK